MGTLLRPSLLLSFIGITINPAANKPAPAQTALLLPCVWVACCPDTCDANSTQHKATTVILSGANDTPRAGLNSLRAFDVKVA